jgi:hypothetical protein
MDTFSIRYMDKTGNQTNKELVRREARVSTLASQWVLEAETGDIIIIEKRGSHENRP